jgi:hypothetical protein
MTSTAARGSAEATGIITFHAAATTVASAHRTFEVLRDLPSHLEWAGRRSAYDDFKLLRLDAPERKAEVGTRFTSTGSAVNGTFHDASVVTEVSQPRRLTFQTDARLDRTRGREWEMRFVHRYDIVPTAEGCRIDYTCTATRRTNYVPYWLRPWARPLTRVMVQRQIRGQLGNLVALAEGS